MRKVSAVAALVLSLWVCGVARELPHVAGLPKLTFTDLPAEVRDQVRQAYDRARTDPESAEASGKLGMLLDLYHHPDQALVCYGRAHQLDPGAFKWLYYMGSLQAKLGRQDEAVETWRRALRLKPDYLPARLKLADSLFTTGQLDESRQIYSAIVKTAPSTAEAYYGLGRIDLARGDTAAASQSFQKACELFPPYGPAHYQLAQIDHKLGKTQESEQELALYAHNRTLVPPIEDPLRDELRSLDRAAASLLDRGIQLEQAGRPEDAIAAEERALQLDPSLMRAHVNLIILYGRAGDFQKAEEHYQAALKLNPDKYPDAFYNYGVLLLKEGKPNEAQAAFVEALKINPLYADAHNDLGYLLEREGRLEQAAAEYRAAVEARPDFRKARYNLARILVSQQRYSEAIAQLQQTLTPVDESTAIYLYALGATYGRAGDHAEAVKYLRQAEGEAQARQQNELVADIERDLRSLGEDK